MQYSAAAGRLPCCYTAQTLRDILSGWVADCGGEEPEAEDGFDEASVVDTDYDSLTGAAGNDWFIIGDGDRITDLRPNKDTGDRVTCL